jgi:hypothetical protein
MQEALSCGSDKKRNRIKRSLDKACFKPFYSISKLNSLCLAHMDIRSTQKNRHKERKTSKKVNRQSFGIKLIYRILVDYINEYPDKYRPYEPKKIYTTWNIPSRSFFDAIKVLEEKNMIVVYSVDGKEGMFINAPPADEWKGLNNAQKNIIKLFKDGSQNDRKIFRILLGREILDEHTEEQSETPKSESKVVSIKKNNSETTPLEKISEMKRQEAIFKQQALEYKLKKEGRLNDHEKYI